MIKSTNFIVVQAWMVTKLKLSGNNLLVFAMIYGFCQDDQTKFTGSLSYIQAWTNASKPTVIKALNGLVELKYLKKTTTIINNIKSNSYGLGEIFTGSKETLPGGSKETLPGGSKETLPNNILNNNILYKDQFISDFNRITGKKIRVLDSKTRRQMKQRIREGYTYNEILKAVENCSKDKHHIENPKYLTPEFITRPDKLQMYLNAVEKSEKKTEKQYTNISELD